MNIKFICQNEQCSNCNVCLEKIIVSAEVEWGKEIKKHSKEWQAIINGYKNNNESRENKEISQRRDLFSRMPNMQRRAEDRLRHDQRYMGKNERLNITIPSIDGKQDY